MYCLVCGTTKNLDKQSPGHHHVQTLLVRFDVLGLLRGQAATQIRHALYLHLVAVAHAHIDGHDQCHLYINVRKHACTYVQMPYND